MATNTSIKNIDLTGGKLNESIVGVATTTVGPGEVHGIKDMQSSINTSILSSNKSTSVAISTSTVANKSRSTKTNTSVENKTWDGASPYIRSKDIYVKSTGIMPKRIHYPFMDNVKINEYTTTVTRVYVTGIVEFVEGDSVNIKDNSNVIVGTAKILDSTKFYNESILYIEILTGTGSVGNTISTISSGNVTISEIVLGGTTNASLTSDKWGGLYFEFSIPSGRFATGDKIIKLSDVDDPFVESNRSTSTGIYSAIGLTHYKQRVTTNTTVTTVKTTKTVTTNKVTTNNISNTVNKVIATNIHYNDPLAQTFIVSDEINPSGVFISSIDLFFKNKPIEPIPLTVQIRNVVNGLPVSFEYVYNGQRKILPSDINLSTDGKTATNVKFINPVYLVPGEYAIVLISNSDEYEVFISTLGRKQIGTDIIIADTQSLGVLLKSSNASTWTPIQESDLTFRLNRAVFTSTGTVQFDVKPTIVSFTGDLLSGSEYISNVTLSNPDRHDMLDLYLNYIVEHPELPSGTKIVEIDIANRKLKLSELATGTSATTTILCYQVIDYSLLSFNLGLETPPGTETNWKYRVLDSVTDQLTEFDNQLTGDVIDFKSTKIIKDETYNSNRVPLRVTGTLSSSDDKLSPILDIASAYGKATKNIINNNSDFETTASGGHADSVYFTKKMPLADGFDASNLTVIFDANRPSVTNIKVYYKVSALDSDKPFDDNVWVEMIQSSTNTPSISDTDFKEYTFVPAGSITGFGIPVDDPINPRFNIYTIKIVLLSSDPAYTPIIKNLRGIALDN